MDKRKLKRFKVALHNIENGETYEIKLIIRKTEDEAIYAAKKFVYDTYFSNMNEDHIMNCLNVKNISIDDNSIKLQVFDTCGAEKYRCITRSYYRSAKGIFLVFDLTNPISFAKLEDWLIDILNSAPKGVEIFLIGNKKDLESRRNVSKRVIENILSKHSIKNYIETSALTGEGVIEAFHKMSEILMDKEKLNKITYGDNKSQVKLEDNDRGSSLYSSTATKSETEQKQGCC